MGFVDIPDGPRESFKVIMELSQDELAQTVEMVKRALLEYTNTNKSTENEPLPMDDVLTDSKEVNSELLPAAFLQLHQVDDSTDKIIEEATQASLAIEDDGDEALFAALDLERLPSETGNQDSSDPWPESILREQQVGLQSSDLYSSSFANNPFSQEGRSLFLTRPSTDQPISSSSAFQTLPSTPAAAAATSQPPVLTSQANAPTHPFQHPTHANTSNTAFGIPPSANFGQPPRQPPAPSSMPPAVDTSFLSNTPQSLPPSTQHPSSFGLPGMNQPAGDSNASHFLPKQTSLSAPQGYLSGPPIGTQQQQQHSAAGGLPRHQPTGLPHQQSQQQQQQQQQRQRMAAPAAVGGGVGGGGGGVGGRGMQGPTTANPTPPSSQYGLGGGGSMQGPAMQGSAPPPPIPPMFAAQSGGRGGNQQHQAFVGSNAAISNPNTPFQGMPPQYPIGPPPHQHPPQHPPQHQRPGGFLQSGQRHTQQPFLGGMGTAPPQHTRQQPLPPQSMQQQQQQQQQQRQLHHASQGHAAPPSRYAMPPGGGGPAGRQQQQYGNHGRGGGMRSGGDGVGPPPSVSPPVRWERCWTTQAEDHNHHPVLSSVYSPKFQGLPGGDGHAGWMISSSRKLLNLWECSGSGGKGGEPSLMLMHSQATDSCSPASMDLDMTSNLLVCASESSEGPAAGPHLSLHSVHAETFLAPKGTLSLQGASGTHQHPRVTALTLLGGPLTSCVAASTASALQVLDLNAGGSSSPVRAKWAAHAVDVTYLHRSRFHITLFSGAANGSIAAWDLQKKPSKPAVSFHQAGPVSALQSFSDSLLLSAGHDGALCLWDLRGGGPLATTQVDGNPVVSLAFSPLHEYVAAVTSKGLYCYAMKNRSFDKRIDIASCQPNQLRHVNWNNATGELVVAGNDGSISVYRDFHA